MNRLVCTHFNQADGELQTAMNISKTIVDINLEENPLHSEGKLLKPVHRNTGVCSCRAVAGILKIELIYIEVERVKILHHSTCNTMV